MEMNKQKVFSIQNLLFNIYSMKTQLKKTTLVLFATFVVISTSFAQIQTGNYSSNANPFPFDAPVTINFKATSGTFWTTYSPLCYIEAWLVANNGSTFSKSYSLPVQICNTEADYALLPANIKMTQVGAANSGEYTITIPNIYNLFAVAEADKVNVEQMGVRVKTFNNGIYKIPFDSINEWKNGFLVCWRGTQDENIRSAKGLGYKYINETTSWYLASQKYGTLPQAKGMRFYLDCPEAALKPQFETIDPTLVATLKAQSFGSLFRDYPNINPAVKDQWFIDLQAYNPTVYANVKATFEKWCCLTDGTTSFPKNLALGWVYGDGTAAVVMDFQQQAVIDAVIAYTIKIARERENVNNDYKFIGIAQDVPEFWNGFTRHPVYNATKYLDWKLDPALTGFQIAGTTHNYTTYREGWLRFMVILHDRLAAEFPDRKIRFFEEPWTIWGDGYCGWWGYWGDTVNGAPFLSTDEKKKVVGDLYSMEKAQIADFSNPTILNNLSNLGITADNLACSSPDLANLYYFNASNPATHLNYLGKLAIMGSWFNSYGCLDRGATTIKQRLPQLTLSRLLVNWENLAMIPLSQRSWDATNQVYDSPNGHADRNIIYAKEPRSRKYYAVWLDSSTAMKLQPGEIITGARATNEYYEENGTGSSDAMSSFVTKNDSVTLTASGKLYQCYIITVTEPSAYQTPDFLFTKNGLYNGNVIITESSSVKIYSKDGLIDARFDGSAKVELYTITGQLLRSALVENQFLQSVKNGAYLIRINAKTHKVIVQ